LIRSDGDAWHFQSPSRASRALVDRLWASNDPADVARLEAQARLIAAYEERRWPRRPPRTADLIRHLMDQHGLTRVDMVPILGTPSRVSEVLRGKKGLSMAMVQRLRARFRVSADLLLPPPKKAGRSSHSNSFEVVTSHALASSKCLAKVFSVMIAVAKSGLSPYTISRRNFA
jgi:HTH-type transcriptional regulator / antitoxin HigA